MKNIGILNQNTLPAIHNHSYLLYFTG